MRLFFLALALFLLSLSAGAPAEASPVYLNPDHPVYASKAHGFRLDLPPGQWSGTLSKDGSEVRFSDAADGDEEFTEVSVRVFSAGDLPMQRFMDEEMKGCREVFDERQGKDWFSFKGVAFNENLVFIKYFFRSGKVHMLVVKSSPMQKPSFDYASEHVEKTFKLTAK